MKFQRIYIEITNVCNLNCSYCLNHNREALFMTPEQFEQILKKVQKYTEHIYLHIKGEPLIHPNFIEFLNSADSYHMKVHLVSNGTLLDKLNQAVINHPALVQCTISLHNYEDLDIETRIQYESDLEVLYQLVDNSQVSLFLRIWNFNRKLTQDYIMKRFNVDITTIKTRKRIKLSPKISLDLDQQFEWPDLKNPYNTDRGSCLAGTKMLVVYANGDVGPCCLDNDASIKLGNLFTSSMEDILQTSRYLNFVEGLKREYLNEPLCQHCTYHHRFKRLDNAI